MDKLKKLFIYFLNIPLYLISKIIPKDPNIWIFGAWHGEKYADNSKYLFEYVNNNHPSIKAIWISKNKAVCQQIEDKGYKAYKAYSMKAIYYGLTAKYSIFIQSNFADNMMFLNNSRTKMIQLWHGIPLKKIGYDDNIFTTVKKESEIKKILFPFTNEKYDLIIACSKEDQKHFSSAFKNNNVVITGYPRNDLISMPKPNNESFKIIYLPTFRNGLGSSIDLFTDYNFELHEWGGKLEEHNISLYIKMHPVNLPSKNILDAFSSSKNIKFLYEEDVADLLPCMDILITDYSSVYFDYLLTDSPIIFAPFDYESYLTKDRKLYYDYNDVTPGPKCNNWEEVLVWIEKFKINSNLYKSERAQVRNKFHKFQDGHSSERVYKEIKRLAFD